jgi:hypothetical protein
VGVYFELLGIWFLYNNAPHSALHEIWRLSWKTLALMHHFMKWMVWENTSSFGVSAMFQLNFGTVPAVEHFCFHFIQ